MKRLLHLTLIPLSLSAAPNLGVDVQDLIEYTPIDPSDFKMVIDNPLTVVSGEVWKDLLEAEIQGANQLEVQIGGAESIFVETPAEVSAFRDALSFEDHSEGGACLCGDDIHFIFKHDDQVLAELSLRGREYLRWQSGAWKGDSLLTNEALDGIGLWLHNHGYSVLHRERIAIPGQEKQRLANFERFKAFFTEDELAFLLPPDKADEETDEPVDAVDLGTKLLAAAPDQTDLLVRIFYALGAPLYYTESGIEYPAEKVAIHAARSAENHVILDALERVRDERWALYGAAELFFEEGLSKRITEPEKTTWALRLAEPVLLYSETAYKKDNVLEMLASLNNPKSNDFLLRVARGHAGSEVGRSGDNADIVGVRPMAYLFLAQNGEPFHSEEMRALMGASFNNVDKQVLQAALALSGNYDLISRKLLKSRVVLVAESTREAIIQSKDVSKVDLLVESIEQDLAEGRNYIEIANLLTFQRAVGKTFYSNPDSLTYTKDPRPLQHAIEWWRNNRENVAQQWAAESTTTPEE